MILSCFFFMAVSSPCPLGRRSSRTAQFLPRPQTCEPQWGWVCACGISFLKASGRTIQPYRKKWFTRKTPQRLDTFICRFSLRSLSFFATFLYHKNILVFLRPVKLEKKYCDKSCSLQLKWWLWRFFHSLNSLGERERVCVCTLSCVWLLCDPIDCSLPVSPVHGVLKARIPEWIAISSSRGSSWPRDQTQVSYIAGRFFTVWV